jgi:ABC-type branched-subunit amino acid transport system ATPase component
MALLELRDIQAGYGSIQILHGVSLHVNAGEVVSVIGPNGAGKSTTFKVIMGFIEHLGGEITFEGKSLVGQRPDGVLALGLGYVPQGRVVFATMTVRENLEMGAYLERDRTRLAQSMDFVYSLFPRLYERRRQMAGTMSGGEQQMVAVARAMVCAPRLLMLDEPSLGLAPRMVDELLGMARRIADAGTTVLMVEQNVKKALAVADRGYVLERGSLVASGPAKLLSRSTVIQEAYLGSASSDTTTAADAASRGRAIQGASVPA